MANSNRSRTSILLLCPLASFDNVALLLLRLMIGSFLVWGVLDNITSAEHMQEFVAFLANFGFIYPEFMALFSVWAQFFAGLSFIFGLLTRWGGIICAINFIVAIVMVDAHGGIRASFASACLVFVGMYLATHGAGRFSMDAYIEQRAST